MHALTKELLSEWRRESAECRQAISIDHKVVELVDALLAEREGRERDTERLAAEVEQLQAPLPRERTNWMRTFTGKRFYPLDPRPEDFCIEDIAHALSMENRYNGHTPEPYSVAQHSFEVSYRASCLAEGTGLWGLLHDASEAYIRDIPQPTKRVLSQYREVEGRVMNAICDRFGLPHEMPPAVHQADGELLATEATSFFGEEAVREWGLPQKALAFRVEPESWRVAETLFLDRFHELA